MDGLRPGALSGSVSDEIGALVKKGYDTWQAFDEDYRANAKGLAAAGQILLARLKTRRLQRGPIPINDGN